MKYLVKMHVNVSEMPNRISTEYELYANQYYVFQIEFCIGIR